jgi:hypothetical protein
MSSSAKTAVAAVRAPASNLHAALALGAGPLVLYAMALLWTVVRSGLPILWADDITRSMYAVQWANAPFFFPPDLVWLPAPMWLDGIAVWLGGNGWEPIFVVNGLCGAVVVLMVIAIAREARLGGALIAGMLAALSPVLVIVSASRLSEPKAWAFTMVGLYFWQRHISTRRPLAYAAAFLFTSLAALSRYELWIVPVALAAYGLLARLRWRTPPLWVVIGSVLPLSLSIGALVFLNLTRFGVPLYGGYPYDVGVAHLIRVLWGTSGSPVQSGDGTRLSSAALLERLGPLAAEVWPYVALHLALALIGCGLALWRRLTPVRWFPFLVSALAGLLAAGALLSGGTGGFNARLVGSGLLPLLPFAGVPLRQLQRSLNRLPIVAISLLAAAIWFAAAPAPAMQLDDVRLATMAGLSWRSVSGLAVQDGDCGWLLEFAARTVLPRSTPSACIQPEASYPAWVPSTFPAGREILVIHRRDADLGLNEFNSFRALAGPSLAFSIVCPPASSYPVPMSVQGVPQRVAPGRHFTVTVTVRNTMDFPWHIDGPCPVQGAWEWSTRPQPGEGTRFQLPRELHPGEEATWAVELEAPAIPGRYRLYFTLVQERSTWFHARPGFQPAVFEVEVR